MAEAPLHPSVVNRLHSLLETSDLDVTTEKHIRLRLESEFNVDLSERKKALRQEIQNYLNSRQQDDEGESEPSPPKKAAKKEKPPPKKEKKSRKRAAEAPAEGEEKKKRGGGGLMKVCSLSPELSTFLGVSELPRTEVVKGIWKYIGEHNLQNPSNRREIMCDAALEQLLGTNHTDMFQLNKLLKPHIHTIPGETTPKPPKEEGAPQGSGLQRPLSLSPELSSFLGTGDAALPRSEVVKRVWAYIKEHNLQDPSNKKVILCDAAMQDLLGVEIIEGFGAITKLLSPHFGKAPVSNGHVKPELALHGAELSHESEHLSEQASVKSEEGSEGHHPEEHGVNNGQYYDEE